MTTKPRSTKVPPLLELSDRVAKLEVDRQHEKDSRLKESQDRLLGWILVMAALALLIVGYAIGNARGVDSGYQDGYRLGREHGLSEAMPE